MASLILRVFRNSVVTILMCTPCFVQGLNIILMVSLFMHITRKHIALVMCASKFYVRNCWTDFDERFYECHVMRSDAILVIFGCLYVVIRT